MIAPQPPPLAVFISAQTVPGADMSSQRLSAVAAIESELLRADLAFQAEQALHEPM